MRLRLGSRGGAAGGAEWHWAIATAARLGVASWGKAAAAAAAKPSSGSGAASSRASTTEGDKEGGGTGELNADETVDGHNDDACVIMASRYSGDGIGDDVAVESLAARSES